MKDPIQKEFSGTPHAPLVRYLGEEGHRRRAALKKQADTEIESIRSEAKKGREDALAACRAEFVSQKDEIESYVLGGVKSEAEAAVLRQMGQTVEQIMATCRDRLQQIAETRAFEPILETLIIEAAQCARDMPRPEADDKLGEILVAPGNADLCRAIVRKHALQLIVKEAPSVWGGVEILVAGTSYRIRNSFPSRMEKLGSSMRETAAQRLRSALSGSQAA